MAHTHALFTRLRSFAAAHARRNFVLLNAHLFEDPFSHLNNSQQVNTTAHKRSLSLGYSYSYVFTPMAVAVCFS